MPRPSWSPRGVRRAIAFSEWLYVLLLHTYPATFRRAYSSRMTRVFRDSCYDAMQQRGMAGLLTFWLYALFDLFMNACLEQWYTLKERTRSMVTSKHTQNFPLSLWIVLSATIIAFIVSLVASLNLYLLEDTSHFTQAAYSISPLLRISYDGIYLSALAAGVSICAIGVYALVQSEMLAALSLSVVTLLVAFGGFGGLLVRHPETFLTLFGVFIALTLMSFLTGRAVAVRSGQWLGRRPAAVLGACVSVGSVLLINVVALVLHTIILNPVSHELYMQGQIVGTHLNFTLIAMGLAVLTMMACVLSLGRMLQLSLRHP